MARANLLACLATLRATFPRILYKPDMSKLAYLAGASCFNGYLSIENEPDLTPADDCISEALVWVCLRVYVLWCYVTRLTSHPTPLRLAISLRDTAIMQENSATLRSIMTHQRVSWQSCFLEIGVIIM